MDRWVNAGVIGTFVCALLQLWADYRLERPAPAPLQSDRMIIQTTGHPVLFGVLHYASPILAGLLLFASVWIAFRKRNTATGETHQERMGREQLYAFFRRWCQDLYRDANNFATTVQNKLSNGENVSKCFAGARRYILNGIFVVILHG
jgi:hypothetical protein